MVSNYQSVEIREVLTRKVPIEQQKQDVDTSVWIRWNVIMTLAVAITLGLILLSGTIGSGMSSGASATASIALIRKSHVSKVRNCSFDECLAATCQALTAPYICLMFNGAEYDGCSVTPWFIPATCDEQCDLSHCDTEPAPEGENGCKYEVCDDAACASKCPIQTPYQCTKGSSIFGCSSDQYLWDKKSSSSTCSKCCDITTC